MPNDMMKLKMAMDKKLKVEMLDRDYQVKDLEE